MVALAIPLGAPSAVLSDCSLRQSGLIPLPDLGAHLYLGQYPGGLYPGGTSFPPPAHLAEGLVRARERIQPRDALGGPAADGRIVLVSIGMSNTTQEFRAFAQRADDDPARNPALSVVDGAQGGEAVTDWLEPGARVWEVLDRRLAAAGVSAPQVQVAWLKQAERRPGSTIGGFPLHAETLRDHLAELVRELLARFPNLQIAYLSSRTRAYTDDPGLLNPEPFAYESGFAVRWLLARQLAGDPTLNHDAARGPVTAPLLLWGPYLWADGENPRSDGLRWLCSDTREDFTHPSVSGREKVAQQLEAFFKTDPTAVPWYLRTDTMAPQVLAEAQPASGMAPLVVRLRADSLDGTGLAATQWTFDDGTSSAEAHPTKTFFVPGTYRARLAASDGRGGVALRELPIVVGDPDDGPAGPCAPGPETLCLLSQRFRVEVSWRDFDGGIGAGRVVPVATEESGLFWFFAPENWELLVKMLDGCALNERHWVFVAGATNAAWTLRITDTWTGAERIYENPLGEPSPAVIDTAAFPACAP